MFSVRQNPHDFTLLRGQSIQLAFSCASR